MVLQFVSNKERSRGEELMLLERISNGEEDALSELYELYSNLLYIVIIKIVKNREEAEDLLQSLFMKIWYKASSFDKIKGNVYSWLVTMARNSAIDKIRSKHYKNNRYNVMGIEESDAFTYSEPTELDNLIINERSEIVSRALKQIPIEQSTVIELAYYGGFTQSEMAEELKIPLGTIKTRMRQAMIKLGKVLNPFT